MNIHFPVDIFTCQMDVYRGEGGGGGGEGGKAVDASAGYFWTKAN